VLAVHTLGDVESGNVEGTPVGVYCDMLVNWALVYPSPGGRYHAEGCMVLG
jgi:hypothetical protein